MSGKQFDQRQKLAIVQDAKEIGFKEAAKIAGVHYTTIYDWQRQLAVFGKEAFLRHRPHRPSRGVKQITDAQEKAILDTWKNNPGFGPGQVRNQLRRQATTISIRTVRKVMQANGYMEAREKGQAGEIHRFEASRPLELAQMDILELYINKLKVFLIILIDDFSRFILGFRLLEETRIEAVIDLVAEAVRRYGKMEEILTDRGFVFYSWRGANRFERYLETERIDHTHARAHHPQSLGKVEALNRRIKSELFNQTPFSTLQQAATAVDKWVDHYNHQRPHQGLGGLLVPGERFHGLAEKVLDTLARGGDVTKQNNDMERSIINLVLAGDGRITVYVLGQPVMVTRGEHD